MSLSREMIKGLWAENVIFRQLIGLCPMLAVTITAVNGLSMGLATLFVLVSATCLISIVRSVIPRQVRLASYVVIIATFVTIADLFLAGNFPPISRSLGPYVPLIIANCLILGRVEAFASKNRLSSTFADALGMGLGFTGALIALGAVRELVGSGSVFGWQLLGGWYEPWLIMILPPGAFLTLGLGLGLINHFTGEKPEPKHVHGETAADPGSLEIAPAGKSPEKV
jgi:Na+-translocating ferredoxin:NAD+ oxidoreductase subunit E